MFEGLERITYKSGDQIFQEGDKGNCAYLIESGSVEVSILREDNIFKVGTLSINDLFGEMALIDNRPRMATVTALEDTRVVTISRELVETKLTNVDPIIKHLLYLILKRFRLTHHKLIGLDHFTSEEISQELEQDFSKTQENLILNVRIASDIKDALKKNQFKLEYQPIKSMMDNKTVGFEALSRWNHPEYGLMSPLEFLSAAENTDQILLIGIWVLEKVCSDIKNFLEELKNSSGSTTLFISINMSARQLAKAEHVAQFEKIVLDAGVDPNCIRLEISESLLFGQVKHAQMILSALRGQGFRVSLDNFGMGYSSLSYLQKLPVDNIKIDKSFISRMLSDHESMQIVKASIGLANALEMEITAKGVESVEVFRKLADMNCTYAQGYFIDRPLPLAAAIEHLKQNQ